MKSSTGKVYVYIKYSEKKPNLPVAIADTAQQLGKITGHSSNTILAAISHGLPGYAKVRIDNV